MAIWFPSIPRLFISWQISYLHGLDYLQRRILKIIKFGFSFLSSHQFRPVSMFLGKKRNQRNVYDSVV